jgi:predicted transcriptional regulator
MKNLDDIAAAIRKARLNAGRSQRSIAQSIGTSQPYIDKLEHNQVDPRYSTVLRILKELDYAVIAIPRVITPLVRDLLYQGDDEPLIESNDERLK